MGYCIMHYTRLRTNGSVGSPERVYDKGKPCVIDGCTAFAGPTGACRKHWHKVNNPLKSRKRLLKAKGMTLDIYERLLKEQGYGCKVCGVKEPGAGRINFAIDHDHTCCSDYFNHCGQCFRGLLCTRCNLVLGQIEDDVELLKKLIRYLSPTPLDRLSEV